MPITTKDSPGKYYPSGGGALTVYATISAIWTIQTINPPPRGFRNRDVFLLNGKASTKVRIFRRDTEEEIAHWNFDIGDTQSPGTHFHVQVLGEDDDTIFPKALDIPRFPSIVITPMDAVDFLLGELFQYEWNQHVISYSSVNNFATSNWRNGQRKRLEVLTSWQQRIISDVRSGNPLNILKSEKPDPSQWGVLSW
jgi:hypothetical protein